MSDANRPWGFENLSGSLTIPGGLPKAAAGGRDICLPGETEVRSLATDAEIVRALNRFGEIMRLPTPPGQLHEFLATLSVLAEESGRGGSSIEVKKALKSAVANLYGFSERQR